MQREIEVGIRQVTVKSATKMLTPSQDMQRHKLTFNISGAVFKFILKFGNQQSSEGLKSTGKNEPIIHRLDEA